MENKKAANWLKAAFIAGAVTDAAAMLPMLVPQMAKIMWGFEGMKTDYYFAMAMGASLMAGWTVLLVWAFMKPLERREVALFTLIVIAGFVITEIVSAASGVISLEKALPSFVLQCILSALFVTAYIKSGKRAA